MIQLLYDAGAAAYDRLTGRWSRLHVPAALALVNLREGMRVLDVATGTGDAAIAAARRVGPGGRVVGIDLSGPMLDIARSKTLAEPVEFIEASVDALPFGDGEFDAVLCLFGLMFFSDPVGALRSFRRLTRAGGSVVATTWGATHQAPFAGLLADALAQELPELHAELLRPFSLANPDVLRGMLEEAGFSGVSVTLNRQTSTFASFEDFWSPIEAGGGRLGQAYLCLTGDRRERIRNEVLRQLPLHAGDGEMRLPLEAWVAMGRATR
jgi:ubiquinone/menaquinone biosynthesis C-methylase UbiE